MASTKKLDDELNDIIRENTNPLMPIKTESTAKINPIPGIKALLFDIYGTLLISGSGEVGTASERGKMVPISSFLSRFNVGLLTENNIVDRIIPEKIESLIRQDHRKNRKKGQDFPEVDILKIWKQLISHLNKKRLIKGFLSGDNLRKTALFYECRTNPVWPMAGAEELLSVLYDSPFKTGIVSNAQFYTEYLLKALLNFRIGSGGFDEKLLFYSYREKIAKPSTEFMNRAVIQLKKLYNINPDEILYLGNDMLNDIVTAARCGCRTALFAGDKRSLRLREADERCQNAEPDLIITDMHQLTGILTEERI